MRRFLVLLLLFGLVRVSMTQTRIMVIGNSITLGTGSTSGTGWRQLLRDSLTIAGYECQFVGPQGNDPIKGHFYAGEEIGSFYTGPGGTGKRDVAASMDLYQPQVVIVHLGSNDLGSVYEIGPYSDDGGTTFNSTTVGGRLATLIAYLLQWQNGVKGNFLKQLSISLIIPRSDNSETVRRALGFYNTLNNIEKDSRDGKIPNIPPYSFRLIDQYTNFQPATMLSADGLHPNDTGYKRMAKVFYGFMRGFAMRFDKIAGDGQRVRTGETLPLPLTIQIRNGYGTPLSNQQVEFQIVSGKAVFTDAQTILQTDQNGTASKSVQMTGEGAAVIGVTTGSTINRTLYFHVGAQDHIHVSGEVVYASTADPVPGVRIEWVESATPIDTTGQLGQYANLKIPLGQSFSVRPLKTRNEDVRGRAVLSYDAGLVARHVVGRSLLDSDGQLAADVNKDGKMNLIDAVQIARYAVGYVSPSGIATGEWTFSPSIQSYPTPADSVHCTTFNARILGDVSGSWTPPSSAKAAWQAVTSTQILHDSLVVTLTFEGGGFLAADAKILFDPSEMKFLSSQMDESLNAFQMLSRLPGKGEVQTGVYGAEEKDAPVSIQWIFKQTAQSILSPIQIENIYVNDCALPEQVLNLPSGPDDALPNRVMLSANYPNPFNPSTTIPFDLPTADQVRLVILNTAGQSVRTLAIGEMPAGRHEIIWNGLTGAGLSAPSGMYLVRLETTQTVVVGKINLVR